MIARQWVRRYKGPNGTHSRFWKKNLTLWKSYLLTLKGTSKWLRKCSKGHRIDLSNHTLCKLNILCPSLLYFILKINFLGSVWTGNSPRDENEKKMGLFNLKRHYATQEIKEDLFILVPPASFSCNTQWCHDLSCELPDCPVVGIGVNVKLQTW